MKQLYEIRHGSRDSIDEDFYLVVDKIPSKEEYSEFKKTTNKDYNIITITDGVVTDCLKGLADEINNSIYYTFDTHTQTVDNPIKKPIRRDVFPKLVMVVRELLAFSSRTHYRKAIKSVMKPGILSDRIEVLSTLDLTTIDDFEKTPIVEVHKFYAQQIGMLMPLLNPEVDNTYTEFFDKGQISAVYPSLKSFLYRTKINKTNIDELNTMLRGLVQMIRLFTKLLVEKEDKNIITLNDGRQFDVKYEAYIGV